MSGKPGNRRESLTILVTAMLVFLVLAGATRAQDGSTPDPNAQDLVRYLLDSLVAERAASQQTVVSKLVEMGPRAVPCLVLSHSTHQAPVQVSVVLVALGRLEPAGVDRYFLAQTAGSGDDPARKDAYTGLAEHGTADAAAALVAQMPDNHYSLKRSAELCLIRLLAKHDDEAAYAGVGVALEGVDDDTRARVICCLGDTDSPHAMKLLLGMLGRHGSLDHAVVSAVAQMPDALPASDVVPHLRELLKSEVPGVARETITALGFFQDTEAVTSLVEILAAAPEGVRGNAHWALKKISGLDFPDDPVRWRLWSEGENSWWESTGKGLLEVLASGEKDKILTALRALGRGRLFRDLIRPAVELLLEDPDPEIRSAAEELMRQLGFAERTNAQTVTAAMASRGFLAAPDARIPERKEVEPEIPRPSRFTGIVPLAGFAVLFVLGLRIFGPAALQRVRRMWTADEHRNGAVTVKLKPKNYRRPADGTTGNSTRSRMSRPTVVRPEGDG